MPQDSGRGSVSGKSRREIVMDERGGNELRAFPIGFGLLVILNRTGKAQQPCGDDRGGRGIPVSINHAFVTEVIPRDSIGWEFRNDVVGNSFGGCQKTRVLEGFVSGSKAIKGPCSPARPGCFPRISLVGVVENALAGSCLVGEVKRLCAHVTTMEAELLAIVTRVVMDGLNH